MTPYKVHDTWVDLDAIIAIGPCLANTLYDCGCNGSFSGQFHSGPIKINLPLSYIQPTTGNPGHYDTGPAEAIWNAFIEAWKSRETKKP